jgi:hypothetical protein
MAGAGRQAPGTARWQKAFASQGRKACFLEKKQQKTFDHFGFGLSGLAQPSFAKIFLVLFFKKELLSATWPLLGVFTLRPPGQLPKKKNPYFLARLARPMRSNMAR